jgi:tetratricopeptide (TPR) repeat protein
VEAEKRALETEGKGVADRLTNLQASYDGLVQKLAETNAALQAFAPLMSKDAFEQAQGMLSRGDVLGAERKFVEIANTVAKIREQADVVEARAIFQAGELADQRIDWRAASTHYARAAKLQPSNCRYAQRAGKLADQMGDYPAAAAFKEATLTLTTSEFGPDAAETATALNNLALTYERLARSTEAEPLYRRAIEIDEKALGKEHPDVATRCNNLASLLQDRASMPRPSRSIGGRSRSTRRPSARSIPALRRITTISLDCFRTRASMPRPSRSIGGRSTRHVHTIHQYARIEQRLRVHGCGLNAPFDDQRVHDRNAGQCFR